MYATVLYGLSKSGVRLFAFLMFLALCKPNYAAPTGLHSELHMKNIPLTIKTTV